MGKRRKGKGKGRKRRAPMTRRSPDSKPKKTAAAPSEDEAEESESDDADEQEEAPKPAAKKAKKKAAAKKEPEPEEEESEAEDSDDSDDGDAEDDDDDVDEDDDSREADSEPPAARQTDAREVEEEGESTIGLPTGADWAQPLVKLEHRWTWLEVRLMFVSLFALMLVLCFWAAVGSMADNVASKVVKGSLFRMIAGASILALVVRLATRKRLDDNKRMWATLAAVVVGVLTARFWRGAGIEFFASLESWLKQGSVFMLFGGLDGVSTRLTMYVSLLGGSLAAASGTHIAIDAVVRLIPKNTRRPAAVGSACATALVCFLAAWGLFDFVAITTLGAKREAPPGEKVSAVMDRVDEHFFLLRKQLLLDIDTLPRVLASEKWNDEKAFTGKDWNDFIDNNGFAERYGEEEVKRIRAPETGLERGYLPSVKVPAGAAAGELKHSIDLMWPLGFVMIGLRFLLRALLILAGHVRLAEEIEIEDEDDAAAEGAS